MPITPETVNDLNTMTAAELRELWATLRPRAKPPRGKRLLAREIAWHVQASARGDLDSATRRLVSAASRGIELDGKPAKKRPRRATRIGFEPGTTFVREWGGSTHEVKVGEDGKTFEYRGSKYRSLTTIAKQITGTHWSGPRFFGLTSKRSSP